MLNQVLDENTDPLAVEGAYESLKKVSRIAKSEEKTYSQVEILKFKMTTSRG